MNKIFKSIVITGFSVTLIGCTPSNTYGLTNKEYRLVDKYYDADEMVEELNYFGYSDEEIEEQLRGALAQVEYEKEE